MRCRGYAIAFVFEVLLLTGLLAFARGFLPPTRTTLGYAVDDTAVTPLFRRVIFMVVDAMRSDFLFSHESHMHKLHDLLRKGKGFAFTAFSDPPTVTLPRLKGLTTGASPNFLDAVINIAESDSASTLQNQDSWVHQFASKGKSLHMYGDDTWLKLFPDAFVQSDGTSSFYVADYTEVDNNVTRHLDVELAPTKQWDALILHYLGLDHIGHKGGPHSPQMPNKQREMDDIAARIFDSLDDDTLFVLAGDHGMNEVGNHGGASEGETSAALALFAKRFQNPYESPVAGNGGFEFYSKVNQIDLVPSLAFLLGFPIPKNSLGLFINDLESLWASEQDRRNIRLSLCVQLGLNTTNCSDENLKEQQRYLMRSSSEHILSYMYLGLGILGLSALLSGILSFNLLKTESTRTPHGAMNVWWLFLPVLYFVGMLGSSTIEEEHFIWYWILSGILACAFVAAEGMREKLACISIIGCFRVMRGWNSAGQKWTNLYDAVDFMEEHPPVLFALTAIAFTYLLASPRRPQKIREKFISTVALLLILTFKRLSILYPLGLPHMIWLARACFLFSALDMLVGGSGVLMLVMQTKLTNIPLWPLILYASKSLKFMSYALPRPALPLIGLCFEYASFFAMGGSNSLATVDLSNAFNGVSGYNIPLVAVLTYLGNWSAPLYWATVMFAPQFKILRVFFYSAACLGISLACLLLREHLFIWTVFSPKFLYEGAWLVFHELIASTLTSLFIHSYIK